MWKFLAENPDAALTVLAAVGGWLGLTKKKANTNALKEKVLARLRKAVLDMIDEYATVDRARAMLNRAANELLEDLGVKRTKTIDAMIEPLIEQALKEYSERLGPILLRMQIDRLFGAVSKLPEAFESKPQPLSPTTEIVERSGDEVYTKPFEGK